MNIVKIVIINVQDLLGNLFIMLFTSWNFIQLMYFFKLAIIILIKKKFYYENFIICIPICM